MTTSPLLAVRDLAKHYALPREHLLSAAPQVHALRGVSFELMAGTSLGVVGESGSGKSTLARLAMALERPSAGSVHFDGLELNALSPAALRHARAGFQMVFQDPFGSLDPRLPVWRTVSEPLAAQGERSAAERRRRAQATLATVGLGTADADKYPHEFSGGQRQRIAIARALVTTPRLIVADEPVSALDVSVQAQVLNLLQDLREQLGLSYLLISHDLGVVNLVCDIVLVLYQGLVVEQGPPATLFGQAAHPYTRALLDAVPAFDPSARQAATVAVAAPELAVGDSACSYAVRCPWRQNICLHQAPPLRRLAEDHSVACHRAEAVLAAGAKSAAGLALPTL